MQYAIFYIKKAKRYFCFSKSAFIRERGGDKVATINYN